MEYALFVWAVWCFTNGIIASAKYGEGFFKFLVLSIFFSPLPPYLYLLAVPKENAPALPLSQENPELQRLANDLYAKKISIEEFQKRKAELNL